MVMPHKILINTAFDFRTDTPADGDPDALSPSLRAYHQILWSKQLPNGALFKLDVTQRGKYLYHQSQLGEFVLTSDSVVPTYAKWKRMQQLLSTVPSSEIESFRTLGYTIGGMMIWPGVPKNGQKTINMARGFDRIIADRMDLTLECVRRHYAGTESPLTDTIVAYSDFFALFESFKGFVDYFFLQDLVSDDYGTVRFFTPFDNFITSGLPTSPDEYSTYRLSSMLWVNARNERINNAYN